MEPYQPSKKGCAARWILVLFIGWALLSGVSPSEAGRGPKDLYHSGKNCQDRLNKSPKLRKFRHNWEACIRDFDALLTQHPTHRLVQNSLFRLGELYTGLYRYSHNPLDIKKSQEYDRELITQYPTSPLAEKAQKRLNGLKGPLPSVPQVTVQNIRHWAYPDYTRLVLDMDRSIQYRQSLPQSDMVLVRLTNTRLGPRAQTERSSLKDGLLREVTVQQADPDTVLLTIALKSLAKQPKIIALSNPERLVIDLFSKGPRGSLGPPSSSKPSGSGSVLAQAIPYDVRTIMIDPGHGGKDPGAIGRDGLTEKEVVLDIGLRLRQLIRERMGKTVIMTREDDTFIALDDRTLIANSKNADLFISIHANAHPQRSIRGVEIYHLGRSSDRRAMAVAARENNISLRSLGRLDRSVKAILFHLGREYNINQSQELAHHTRQSFKTTMNTRYDTVDLGVKRAPFYVLLNSNMPSILAEVAFISNTVEERLLQQSRYRQTIAESLFQGISSYLTTLKPIS